MQKLDQGAEFEGAGLPADRERDFLAVLSDRSGKPSAAAFLMMASVARPIRRLILLTGRPCSHNRVS
jgi:hypothetical protein